MHSRSKIWAYIFLIIGVITIGFTAIFVKWANAPGTVTAFYRMFLSSIFMLVPFLFHLKKTGWHLSSRGVLFAIAGGICFGTDIAFWMTGVMMGEPTIPTLMANTAPVWVGLISWLFLKEKQGFQFWMGLLLALGCAAIILGVNFSSSFHMGMGAVLGLIASFLYSGFHLFSQRGRALLNTLAYFWIFTTSGAIVLLCVNLVMHQPFWGYGSVTVWNFIGIALIGHVFGWMCIGYAQGHLPASLIAPSVLIQPVVTAILAYWFFGNTFSPVQMVSGLGVITGIFIVHRSHLRDQKM